MKNKQPKTICCNENFIAVKGANEKFPDQLFFTHTVCKKCRRIFEFKKPTKD